MTPFVFHAESEADTERFGAALAQELPPGTTVALCGTLGAGKTRLVQAIAAASGIDRAQVVSPTFVLCQKYAGKRTIYHLDAYRLKDDDEFRELGVHELFDSGALVIVEWADKVADCLPDERIEIDIEAIGPTARRFIVRGIGEHFAEIVEGLRTKH